MQCKIVRSINQSQIINVTTWDQIPALACVSVRAHHRSHQLEPVLVSTSFATPPCARANADSLLETFLLVALQELEALHQHQVLATRLTSWAVQVSTFQAEQAVPRAMLSMLRASIQAGVSGGASILWAQPQQLLLWLLEANQVACPALLTLACCMAVPIFLCCCLLTMCSCAHQPGPAYNLSWTSRQVINIRAQIKLQLIPLDFWPDLLLSVDVQCHAEYHKKDLRCFTHDAGLASLTRLDPSPCTCLCVSPVLLLSHWGV